MARNPKAMKRAKTPLGTGQARTEGIGGFGPGLRRVDILTLFPEYFQGPFSVSIVKRALDKKALTLKLHYLRQWAEGKRNTVDDVPFGGGAGMVLKPEPMAKALAAIKRGRRKVRTVYLSPQGKKFDHAMALEFSKEKDLLLVCGHYEGLDERAMAWMDDEVSIGDFVLTGGEPAAAVIVDALVRFLPGVVGDRSSVEKDSFFNGLLDHPHYTRPRLFKGMEVPEVLLSGNHALIEKWRKKQSLRNTLVKRPDLLGTVRLDEAQKKLLAEAQRELENGSGA